MGRGWCGKHYYRWNLYGDPNYTKFTHYKTPEEAFAARTEWQGDCLVWTGGTNRNGYGTLKVGHGPVLAHRYAYAKALGEIPEGLILDHKCQNPPCCNPEHLRLATHKQNGENLVGARPNSVSGFRGVHWDSKSRKWYVRVMHNRKTYSGGRFEDVQEANVAAIALRNKLFTFNNKDRQ